MRKLAAILIVLLFLYGITTLSFAQTSPVKIAKKAEVKTEVIKGKIISIDPVKNEVVIKDNKTGVDKTIVVDSKVISSLKTGEEVKATLKSGSNIAESIKKVVHKKITTKK